MSEFAAFCLGAGAPRADWQAESMSLKEVVTVIVAPRQTGKTETVELLAAWEALRMPNLTVMLVSSSDGQSGRSQKAVRRFCDCQIAGEDFHRTALMNGSQILCVPPERASIVGWSVDVLIIDDAAFIEEDILNCALKTTVGADAKVVLISAPWEAKGIFHEYAKIRAIRWDITDAPWIDPRTVEAARRVLPEGRFRSEYLAEFPKVAAA
ncbi:MULTISPECIES: terminase large subunit domain-containing protein [Arthrobacter]|uniref:Uncharacterized protein n=1 Tax=Arthrobacter terricola TaxID=2547396 RepID=A0A4R5KMV8_9MICC|nr:MULTISPECIES: terminase family protein [Arthrobacter]MBT8161002.1 hypothetical protein [Arthrobacter sp. GN70]TDF96866.1 hypothetical protein E1809_09080 [Arthrobacter terricola]